MTLKPDSYFAHDADIGIIGRGATLCEALVSAAEAMFAIMVDIQAVAPLCEIIIDFEEAEPEYALVTWLNLLIAKSQSQNLILGRFELTRDHNHWHGRAWGEPWRASLLRGTEVKGATLTELRVQQIDDHWEARCVVDV